MSRLSTLFAAALFTLFSTQGIAQMTDAEIRQGYREHAALAQFHRWYQFYEWPEGGIANALDVLTDDVVVESGLGTAKGHEEYKARVTQLPDSWQNAHHIQSTEITHGTDGMMTLTADVVYQNQGMLEDGSVRQANLTYSVKLVPGNTVLPLLSNVLIEQRGETDADAYRDAYAENRVKSLVHYWLALIEAPSRNPEPAREILADTFSLNFSSGTITDFEGFSAWLAGPASQVAASTHVLGDFEVKETGSDTYAMSVDFDWTGVTPDGTILIAKTRHNWTVENDPAERFARIKTIDVDVLENFRPRDS